jgi:large subunit ribosomal protein L29
MKAEKIRDMSASELTDQVTDLQAQIWKLRFQSATGQTEGLGKIRNMRKDIARAKTILRERELKK